MEDLGDAANGVNVASIHLAGQQQQKHIHLHTQAGQAGAYRCLQASICVHISPQHKAFTGSLYKLLWFAADNCLEMRT